MNRDDGLKCAVKSAGKWIISEKKEKKDSDKLEIMDPGKMKLQSFHAKAPGVVQTFSKKRVVRAFVLKLIRFLNYKGEKLALKNHAVIENELSENFSFYEQKLITLSVRIFFFFFTAV